MRGKFLVGLFMIVLLAGFVSAQMLGAIESNPGAPTEAQLEAAEELAATLNAPDVPESTTTVNVPISSPTANVPISSPTTTVPISTPTANVPITASAPINNLLEASYVFDLKREKIGIDELKELGVAYQGNKINQDFLAVRNYDILFRFDGDYFKGMKLTPAQIKNFLKSDKNRTDFYLMNVPCVMQSETEVKCVVVLSLPYPGCNLPVRFIMNMQNGSDILKVEEIEWIDGGTAKKNCKKLFPDYQEESSIEGTLSQGATAADAGNKLSVKMVNSKRCAKYTFFGSDFNNILLSTMTRYGVSGKICVNYESKNTLDKYNTDIKSGDVPNIALPKSKGFFGLGAKYPDQKVDFMIKSAEGGRIQIDLGNGLLPSFSWRMQLSK